MKKLILCSVVFSLAGSLAAQDIHFSQWQQTPQLVNPALVGNLAVFRAGAIYKQQWSSVTVPFQTYGASVDMKFKASNWEKVPGHTRIYKRAFSRLAGGLAFYNDKAGDGKMGQTQINLALATMIPLNKQNTLAVGLQGTVTQRKIDYSQLVFPDQYNGTGFDPTIATNEDMSANNFVYGDVSGGINWSYGYSERAVAANTEFRANIGVSAFHLNRPQQKYLMDTYARLNTKYVAHGDALIGIRNTNVALVPSVIAEFQGRSVEMLEGFMVKYYIKDDSKYTGYIKRSAFGIGGAYRNKDAIIASMLVEVENYAFGFSYDFNLSGLTAASAGRGGMEVFLRFVTPNPFLYQQSKARFL